MSDCFVGSAVDMLDRLLTIGFVQQHDIIRTAPKLDTNCHEGHQIGYQLKHVSNGRKHAEHQLT